MEQILFKNLSFTYPLTGKKALDGVDLGIDGGEFIVLCGRSGCGKTTLLRHLKTALIPEGKHGGEVLIDGRNVADMTAAESASTVGFVMQDPEMQIVTDKVWHELAFGLESLGADKNTIRMRTAEMAAYFGMQSIFDCKISELSGGQKQLLNLASVMTCCPKILLLDEPTSQLDPVAAENFIATVARINRELGVTVVMTEHRLEEVFALADRVIVMDGGRVVSDTPPRRLCGKGGLDGFLRLAAPAPVRIFSAVTPDEELPLTVREAAKRLAGLIKEPEINKIENNTVLPDEKALELKDVSFRYSKEQPNIINELSLSVPRGCVLSIMGGNAAGKSTLLRLIAGILPVQGGKIRFGGKERKKSGITVGYMPQNPQTLFTMNSLRKELAGERMAEAAELAELTELLDRHPYDLSGGEQQRAAMAKLLVADPDIYLLDEPTKGMDCEFKRCLAEIFTALKSRGKTVITVSHDVEFCAASSDICAMLFDGVIAGAADARSFFAGNYFYTTAANRLSRQVFKNCVTDADVIELCRENMQN